MKIEIVKTSDTEITRERDPNDSWDADDTHTCTYIEGIKKVDTGYFDLEIPDYPLDGTYYLLYVEYSTGDSFSHHSGIIEYIGVYNDKKLAIKNKYIIEHHYKNYKEYGDYSYHYSLTLLSENNLEYKIYCPWIGYFEHLDFVEIKEVKFI